MLLVFSLLSTIALVLYKSHDHADRADRRRAPAKIPLARSTVEFLDTDRVGRRQSVSRRQCILHDCTSTDGPWSSMVGSSLPPQTLANKQSQALPLRSHRWSAYNWFRGPHALPHNATGTITRHRRNRLVRNVCAVADRPDRDCYHGVWTLGWC